MSKEPEYPKPNLSPGMIERLKIRRYSNSSTTLQFPRANLMKTMPNGVGKLFIINVILYSS